MKQRLIFSLCESSAKTFAIRMMNLDVAVATILTLAGGSAALWFGRHLPIRQLVMMTLSTGVGTYSAFVILRTLVPFMTRLSFIQTMRLRVSFYIWIASLFAAVGVCGIRTWVSSFGTPSIQLALVLASFAFTIRFFHNGSLPRLALAFFFAGSAFGISLMGGIALTGSLLIMRLMSANLMAPEDNAVWYDAPHQSVYDYYTNESIRSRSKWVFGICFFFGAALALLSLVFGDDTESLSDILHAWLKCVGLDSLMFLLMTAILPLIACLCKSGQETDMAKPSNISAIAVYVAIIPLTALFMLKPLLLPSIIGLRLNLDIPVLTFTAILYVFNILLAGLVILADIRCRDFHTEYEEAKPDELRGAMLFTYAVISIAPLALVACAVILALLGAA